MKKRASLSFLIDDHLEYYVRSENTSISVASKMTGISAERKYVISLLYKTNQLRICNKYKGTRF